MNAPQIQIAFQGGGAKLIAMLPIAAAFKKCHDDGIIKITAVSGASAGSIYAALIAGEADFSKVVNHINLTASDAIDKVVSKDVKNIVGFLNSSRIAKIGIIASNFRFFSDIALKGSPILNEKEFEKFIKELLNINIHKKFEDSSIKLYINTSDIVNQDNKTISSGIISNAAVDSCAIPFVFRSFDTLRKSHNVDGGLCQNLPTDILAQNSEDPIFAVFPEEAQERKEITNILEYCFSLFSASINHSVKRSQSKISKAFAIAAPCSFSTFDFKAAVEKLKEPNWYEQTKREYEDYIRDFSNNYGHIHSEKQYRFADVESKSDYSKALDVLTSDYHEYISYDLGKFHIFVKCSRIIHDNLDEKRREADNIVKTARITILKDGFRYYRSFLGIDNTTKRPRPTVWLARNLTKGIELDISVLALNINASGKNSGMHCVVIFNKAETQISVGDQIEIIDSSNSKLGMVDMNRGKNDFTSIENEHNLSVLRAELIITYPKSLGKYIMISRKEHSTVSDENCHEIDFSSSEIENINGEYDIIGIYTENLPAKNKFSGLAVKQS